MTQFPLNAACVESDGERLSGVLDRDGTAITVGDHQSFSQDRKEAYNVTKLVELRCPCGSLPSQGRMPRESSLVSLARKARYGGLVVETGGDDDIAFVLPDGKEIQVLGAYSVACVFTNRILSGEKLLPAGYGGSCLQ